MTLIWHYSVHKKTSVLFELQETPETMTRINIWSTSKRKQKQGRKSLLRNYVKKNRVYTMDLQSVLLSPDSNVSILYYKKKLVLHNFTIYNIKTKEAFCFLWNELEGSVGANEFATIISNFIAKECQDLPRGEEIILYSEGCTGQNRNVVLPNALLHLANEKNIRIMQKYLEKGHTQMEADTIHSLIERQLKKEKNNVPADYVNVCVRGRKVPEPFKVEYLTHEYFKNYTNINFVNSIRPGKKTGDPTVQNLRAVKYEANGNLSFKLRHSHQWQPILARINKNVNIVIFPLYYDWLKRELDKFEHLQTLKQCIPADYHAFYDAIPHY